MESITRNQSFGVFVAATRIIVLVAALGGVLAEARQPINASPLLGTWVNINTATRGLVRIIITDVSGDFEVHPYGACSPTPCDWGMHPALRFSSAVTSATAIGFNVVITSSFKTSYVQGHLIKTATGQTLLEVTTQTKFTGRGDLREDYEMTERFQLK